MKTSAQYLARSALALAALLAASLAPQSARADAAVYQNLIRSTAWVISFDSAPGSKRMSMGSGVLVDVDNRLVVTNEHVVGDEPVVTVFFAKFKNGRPITDKMDYYNNRDRLGIQGRVLAADSKRDVAIVQLERLPEGVSAVEMAQRSVMPGEEIHAIGNPGESDALWVYHTGTVRNVYRKKYRTGKLHDMVIVESDLPCNQGDSGGPVVNNDGKLVAITQGFNPRARQISFSVDISEIRALLNDDLTQANLKLGELIAGTGMKVVQNSAKAFAVDFSTGGGTQRVFVAKDTERYGKTATRRVFAVAHVAQGKLPVDAALKLLEQNARTKLGSWAIEPGPNGQTLVVFIATSDATASSQRLKTTMEYVAKIAAGMKAELAGR